MSETPRRYYFFGYDLGLDQIEHPEGDWMMFTEHDRIVAEMQAEIARLTAERDAIAALTVERCAEIARATGFSRRDSKAIAAAIRSLSKQAEKDAEIARLRGAIEWFEVNDKETYGIPDFP